MQPGLSRAIPMGIIGFMFGALIVIVLRGLQSLDPIWAPGPGLIMAVVMTAVFFVWGMGAFDSRLSIHGDPEAEEVAHESLEKQATAPRGLLVSSIWQLVTIIVVLAVVLGGFAAFPGGLSLTQTVVPGASTKLVGFAEVALPFGGPTILVSTLVIFAAFIIIAFLSLAAFAWVIMLLITFLSRGVAESKVLASGGTLALASGGVVEPKAPPTRNERIRSLGIFIATFVILFLFFYYVAIGLIMPAPELPGLSFFFDPPTQLVIISALNALIFTFVILRTQLVLHTIGRVARWLAKVLRGVPRFLQ